ncbi:hypothetical protein ACFXAS_13285 [Streptomyces sp. NPDC059459]|uniref:hypothetical protein n=1 Tax=Streptomyces sp. NPDC059459 TaxID=3346839 RepID=UPI0036BB6580
MPADEVTRGTDVESSRVRTGPRHAAPKKPLFTRFHVPAGKAIALAAMPTAVLMGMGFTPTLALADGNDSAKPTSNSLTADEYKDCVAALEDAEKGASASPTPSPSATDGASAGADEDQDDTKEPSPSESEGSGEDSGTDAGTDQGGSSSPDSGSDDEADPAPSPSASQEAQEPQESQDKAPQSDAAEPTPSESESRGGVLEGLGDAIEDIFTGGKKDEESPAPTPVPSASGGAEEDASGSAQETADKATDTAKDAVEDPADAASKAAEDTGEPAGEATEEAKDAVEEAKEAEDAVEDEATASPTPSASESTGTDLEDCPVATDEEGGVDNPVPLPDDPWYLNASSLLLKGASYEGIVEVRTANGTTKKVLKYVISNGTDIGDLHQTVKDEQAGKTYHVQAAKGSTSTIRDGDTVMYTESISGNLLGLIPITFDPENPPPLDIPLIYFTKVTVVQAGQFGGTLHIPGLHQYTTD